MDTPEHHCNLGLAFLDQDNPREAARESDLALGLDSGYGPAWPARDWSWSSRG
ncbi:hypothetical protein [Desulfoplanes formicivorans]|uniref:hypothetical protein n=1 Tax=Desulfoplanes formicivorans TaxID=1592317 RepID=UPI0015B4AE07|nr:hypothetical protein [Desulfoplanes formicivorans]